MACTCKIGFVCDECRMGPSVNDLVEMAAIEDKATLRYRLAITKAIGRLKRTLSVQMGASGPTMDALNALQEVSGEERTSGESAGLLNR